MKKVISILTLVLVSWIAHSQCPSVDFSIPASVCAGSSFQPAASVSNAVSYAWDMCDGSLLNTPETKVNFIPAGLPDIYDLKYVQDNGNHFSFVVSYSANRIFRFDHDADITSVPQVVDLGDLGITLPLGIGFTKESSLFFALVVTEPGKLYRLAFGTSVSSIPTVTEISGLALTDHRQMKIVLENGSVFALIAGGNSTQVSILDFGNSITNQPTQSFVQVPTGNIISSLDVISECDQKYSLVSTFGDGIYLLDFGGSFANTPNITKPVAGGARLGLSVIKSNGNYHAFVSSHPGGIDRLDFGNSIENTPDVVNLGTFGGINLAIGFVVINSGSRYYGISANNSNGRYQILDFPKDCGYDSNYPDLQKPDLIKYDTPGTYFITLTAKSNNEELVTATKTVTVTSQLAPVPDFNASHQCQANPITFTASTEGNETITAVQWDFGDISAPTSDLPAEHQYASIGVYTVTMEITVANSCTNIIEKDIKIYEPPSAAFSLPSGLICTNDQLTFTNNTLDNFDGNLSYQWYIDNVPVADTRDLLYTFASATIKLVKLNTSIPGCSDEFSQNTPEILPGPVIDFSAEGNCESDNVQFTGEITGEITSQTWDFDDGNTSTEINPVNTFVTAGEYSVSLLATSTNGCNNSITKPVIIYSLPVVDFSVPAPPLSCTGTSTQFSNLTADPPDGIITTWFWNFDDPGTDNTSTLQDPAHTFTDAGTYDITLTASTEEGCLNFLQKTITIEQSPTAVIENSVPCINLPVNFTATGNDIQSYYWEIGTSYYTESDPVHTFSLSGEYQILLTVQGNNNCETMYQRDISLPVPLVPDFSVIKNCVDHQTEFTDVTMGNDPVILQEWNFGNATATGSPALHSFNTLGSKSITLTVTAASGCSYSIVNTIDIKEPPVAGFTASSEIGAMPLRVQFTNTSTDASQFEWTFGDVPQGVSSDVSPEYIFQNTGEFVTELKASNDVGCESTTNKLITVITPLPDVDVRLINVSENMDGSTRIIITIQNKGNTILEDLPVDIDISGKVSLREIIEGPIAPASMYNLVLSYSLTQLSGLSFLCANATLANDLVPEGNRICTELNDNVFLFTPYPNPVEDELVLEWIAPSEETGSITLVDTFGKTILSSEFSSTPGLNSRVYDVSHLESGVYILIYKAGSISKTQRIFISAEN